MLRKNVAGQFVHIAAVNATNGAALTGATISIRRCIDGTFAAGGATITEDTGLGFYKVALTQADTNGNDIGYFFTATNMIPVQLTCVMTAADPTDAVHLGLTALPNAAAGANTGLPVVGTQVPNATAGAANGLLISGSNAGTTTLGAFTVTGATTLTGAVSLGSTLGVTGNVTLSGAAGLAVTNGITANITGNLVGTVSTLTTYTGNTPQTGDNFVRIGAAGAGLTALGDVRIANLDAAITTRMATYAQPAGFLAVTFPAGTIASTTNISAGTITTATNLTNAPTIGDLTAAMKTSVENAVWDATMASHVGAGSMGAELNAAGGAGDPWITALPGAYGAGSAGFILGTYIDAAISSRLAAADIALAGGVVSADVKKVNGVTIVGDGSGTPFNV